MKNKILLVLIFFILTGFANAQSSLLCSIFVVAHGLEKMSDETLTKLNAFRWNYQDEIINAAKNLAPILNEKINACGSKPVIIKAHGYGMSVVYHILGIGKRYVEMFPEHAYVKIYKKVTGVYSIAGAFRGTPLMDRICTNTSDRSIAQVLGKKCIFSMTTAPIHHPSYDVNSPGVPVYLISSTFRGDENSNRVKMLGSYGLTWEEYFIHDDRNQSDGVIPLFSALGCEFIEPMLYKDSDCEKINEIYFKNYNRNDFVGHYDLLMEKNLIDGVYDEK
ncbi:MAG: hypothetical protein A2381_05790 [Bdellovibrionales bacterium RIFOXYB1_FULL_37_110]|nr:MAG: hypothetical protein A2417_04675 [Bdellovibrionales bacterium RIFOXYC1_FULL_37_79]OFZ59333.1 MAG: hypothetical protein A2381_05790 [Bdellovibrionales bacterium RIFOXYB1_FULL_37_110]OFZ61893.1 MAG: hypothetical protein A2577_17675 [Bdellovibrionales bacterium RIFOXYD1_FULL_36_51]